MTDDLKFKQCFAPPSKATIVQKLNKIGKDQKISIGITEKHVPDKKWMVLVLGHLSPKDEIFSKDYVPPPVRKRKESPKSHFCCSRLPEVAAIENNQEEIEGPAECDKNWCC